MNDIGPDDFPTPEEMAREEKLQRLAANGYSRDRVPVFPAQRIPSAYRLGQQFVPLRRPAPPKVRFPTMFPEESNY